MGCPGQIGQVSFAALSHTVKTKCFFAAPGLANSSQLLLRAPAAGKPAASSCCKAYGLTRPVGRLPALNPRNVGAPMVQDGFGKVGACGVAGTKKQHVILRWHQERSYPQQVGPQQAAAAGFVARITALMNLPSMSGATRSGSRPRIHFVRIMCRAVAGDCIPARIFCPPNLN